MVCYAYCGEEGRCEPARHCSCGRGEGRRLPAPTPGFVVGRETNCNKPQPCLPPESVQRHYLIQSRWGKAARRGCLLPPARDGCSAQYWEGAHPSTSQAFPRGPPLRWRDVGGGASPQCVILTSPCRSSEAASSPAFVPLPSSRST